MYIEEIRFRNFKNFKSEKIILKSGVNVILGENDSGKTNLMHAIRLILDKKISWYDKELKEDFFSFELQHWKGHIIIITIVFNDLNKNNEFESLLEYETTNLNNRGSLSMFILPKNSVRANLNGVHEPEKLKEMLDKLSLDDYETIFTVGLDIDYTNDENYINLVGDFSKGEYKLEFDLDDRAFGCKSYMIEKIRNELISFTYIDALRDSVREMNQKSNPLMSLIKRIEKEISNEEKQKVIDEISTLNTTISSVSEIKKLAIQINNKIKDSIGNIYSPKILIKSDMSDEIKSVFRNLKIKSLDEHELGLEGLGLGSNNIIYIALKLLENMIVVNESKKFLLLLFEEPEAHLHKHLQMTLFEKTNIYEENNVQILLTTHSDNISSASKIGNMSIIQKSNRASKIIKPTVGLSTEEISRIERYLDVKRSELLFSKSVILVEGDAEEILIPIMVKKVLGLSLDEIGVSLINIGSVGFENVYKLFNTQRITKKCAILSDLDKPIDGSATNIAYERGINRKRKIEDESLVNDYVKGFFGEFTLEVELVPNNVKYYKNLIFKTYQQPSTIEIANQEIENEYVSTYGKRALQIADYNSKGWNAILLSEIIDGKFYIPQYILNALLFVAYPMLVKENNIKTMLLNYGEIYEDAAIVNMLDDDSISLDDIIDKVINSETQIIKFIKDVLL